MTDIFSRYKIMSPKIELEIESCAFDERANLIYLKIFQVFSIWLIPFYRAPVNLVTVLHLTSKPAVDGVPPPPYDGAQGKVDAAQETLHKVQEGAEPSYASVAAGDASGGLSRTSSSSSAAGGPRRYYIQRQEDLYQVNEFLKFLTLSLGPSVWGFVQLFATLFCVVGMALLGPLMKVVSPAKPEKARKA
ncbi:hypothetical protein N0V88_002997 [Collariella sp. IMI 366227]|nr:hypothetical protein N0V88_002997 [Collariella sp. IMI 366227]